MIAFQAERTRYFGFVPATIQRVNLNAQKFRSLGVRDRAAERERRSLFPIMAQHMSASVNMLKLLSECVKQSELTDRMYA